MYAYNKDDPFIYGDYYRCFNNNIVNILIWYLNECDWINKNSKKLKKRFIDKKKKKMKVAGREKKERETVYVSFQFLSLCHPDLGHTI